MAISPLLILYVSALALASAWRVDTVPAPYDLKDAELHFKNFMQKYERNYADESEKQGRFEIFKENLNKINSLNEDSDHAVFGITQFSDMSHEEVALKINCFASSPDSSPSVEWFNSCKYLYDEDITDNDAPESFDWRDHGVVTPVKDQGNCGSCFAFSAIGHIEGQHAIKHKKLIRLSEQQIVDCDRKINQGCNGGFLDVAFRSLIKQGGSQSEADYPYEANDTLPCRFDANKVKVKINNCRSFNLTSQEKLKQVLYHRGPIAIAVQADGLLSYTAGIISDAQCDKGRINHAVLLVGYGSEGDKPFWIAKNSWGTIFGEDGYFRMERGEDALSCSVLNDYMAIAIIA